MLSESLSVASILNRHQTLPPAYEVRGKAMFSLCLSIHRGEWGVPQPGAGQGTPILPLPHPLWSEPGQGTLPTLLHPPMSRTGYPTPTLSPLGRNCHGQDTACAVRLLHFHTRGPYCFFYFLISGACTF